MSNLPSATRRRPDAEANVAAPNVTADVGIVESMNEKEIDAGMAVSPGYRYADISGGQLFVAGQVPRDRDGNLVGIGNTAAQATACLDNLHILLDVHDFAVDDIRQLVIYVVGERQNLLDAWAAVTDWFNGDVPPATLLGISLLGYDDQLVEMDATIVRRAA